MCLSDRLNLAILLWCVTVLGFVLGGILAFYYRPATPYIALFWTVSFILWLWAYARWRAGRNI